MSSQYGDIDEHIARLQNGGTLTENEVKNLCELVSSTHLQQVSRIAAAFATDRCYYPAGYGTCTHDDTSTIHTSIN